MTNRYPAVPRGELNEEYIVPSVFDLNMVKTVGRAVAAAAHSTGVARRTP